MTPRSGREETRPVLSARRVTVKFGGLRALSDVDIEVAPATIVGLVGPNGAGKSTMLAVLSGLLRPSDGHVELRGEDVTSASPQLRARMDVALPMPQTTRQGIIHLPPRKVRTLSEDPVISTVTAPS